MPLVPIGFFTLNVATPAAAELTIKVVLYQGKTFYYAVELPDVIRVEQNVIEHLGMRCMYLAGDRLYVKLQNTDDVVYVKAESVWHRLYGRLLYPAPPDPVPDPDEQRWTAGDDTLIVDVAKKHAPPP